MVYFLPTTIGKNTEALEEVKQNSKLKNIVESNIKRLSNISTKRYFIQKIVQPGTVGLPLMGRSTTMGSFQVYHYGQRQRHIPTMIQQPFTPEGILLHIFQYGFSQLFAAEIIALGFNHWSLQKWCKEKRSTLQTDQTSECLTNCENKSAL